MSPSPVSPLLIHLLYTVTLFSPIHAALFTMPHIVPFNCTHYPELQLDSDVTGIGVSLNTVLFVVVSSYVLSQVLSSFVGSAYLTLICCVSKAIIDRKRFDWEITPILDRWSLALGVVIINLSDQQVVTGISILLAAVYRLHLEIQVYHWQTVVNLAWLSTMTHLITLTVLRGEARVNKIIRISASLVWDSLSQC